MTPSGALEIYFSLMAEDTATKKPFYFHHIPKTAGTSLRQSVRQFMAAAGVAGNTVVTDFKPRCEKAGQWPGGLYVIHDKAREGTQLNAVMSHYTALLAHRIDNPIVAIVRQPDEQFRSAVGFFERRVRDIIRKRGSIDSVLEADKVNNLQIRSLSGERVPQFAPSSARRLERWIKLVDRVVERFTLFPLSRYAEAFAWIQEEYGMTLTETRVKRGRSSEDIGKLVDEIMAQTEHKDPVWLDRILYDRVSEAFGAPAEA